MRPTTRDKAGPPPRTTSNQLDPTEFIRSSRAIATKLDNWDWEIQTIAFRHLLHALKRYARNLLENRRVSRPGQPEASSIVEYAPLKRLVLADEVNRTLFAEFARHRESNRGKNETGWLLFGLRTADEAIALATLPAGINYDAGVGHVLFNSTAQSFASRVLRQGQKQLKLLGVVHTHPGSMRHPSDGDYRGDVAWVANLRGQEGVFGIGTADAKPHQPGGLAWQPAPNVQCLEQLCFSWYSLGTGDRNYQPLPVEITIGPDLALGLRPVWAEVENHAERLDRLAGVLKGVTFDVLPGKQKPAFAMSIPLPEPGKSIRVLMEGKDVRYLLLTPDGEMIADFRDDRVDRGVFVMLAELAK